MRASHHISKDVDKSGQVSFGHVRSEDTEKLYAGPCLQREDTLYQVPASHIPIEKGRKMLTPFAHQLDQGLLQ